MDIKDLHQERQPSQVSENRITNIITTHWNQVRGKNPLASEKDLDINILSGVIDNCFLIRTKELLLNGQHKYTYIGKNILSAYGSDIITPHDYHDVDPLSHKNKFEEVIALGRPITEEGQFINKNGHMVKYRQCLMPLGVDGRTIDSIFGGMRFKIFDNI